MTRLFVVAGEDSGDAHAAEVVTALRTLDPGVELEGFGGPRMAAAGARVHRDLVSRSVMGYLGVLRRLPEFSGLLREAAAALAERRPDLLVCVDYPGFNLRLAARARGLGVRVAYYVSPQLWAWRPGRVRTVQAVVDRMLVILPFETPLYQAAGVPVEYVGHPLVDRLRDRRPGSAAAVSGEPVLALLPGSREDVLRRNLPVMLSAARRVLAELPALRLVLPLAKPSLRTAALGSIAREGLPVLVTDAGAVEVLASARGALVTSGTSALEAAVLQVPHAILYKVRWWQAPLPRLLVRSPFIGMPNLLAGERIVPEFLMARADPAALAQALLPLLRGGAEREACLRRLAEIPGKFGPPGAADRAARALLREAAVARALRPAAPPPAPAPEAAPAGSSGAQSV
ncbi:MAG: lipid-A-disaccharide synthase [Planctomycetales bacterium]|nr:lipid-A-disaccharide synthase [Planctomycetales bacterium]